MGKDFQKSALQTLLHFVRVKAAHQPHVATRVGVSSSSSGFIESLDDIW